MNVRLRFYNRPDERYTLTADAWMFRPGGDAERDAAYIRAGDGSVAVELPHRCDAWSVAYGSPEAVLAGLDAFQGVLSSVRACIAAGIPSPPPFEEDTVFELRVPSRGAAPGWVRLGKWYDIARGAAP